MISNLLTLTYCIYTEIFLKEAGILETCANIMFEEYNKVLQYDLEDVLEDIRVNQD